MERCRRQRLATQWLNNRKQYFMSCKKIWLTDRSMDSCARQRRAALTFSVINQSLLSNPSEMSLERAQRLLRQNPGADEPHLTSRRQLGTNGLSLVNTVQVPVPRRPSRSCLVSQPNATPI